MERLEDRTVPSTFTQTFAPANPLTQLSNASSNTFLGASFNNSACSPSASQCTPTAGENYVYATHNGGQRWKGNESGWQYKTILEWIRGARLETAQTQSGGGSR